MGVERFGTREKMCPKENMNYLTRENENFYKFLLDCRSSFFPQHLFLILIISPPISYLSAHKE